MALGYTVAAIIYIILYTKNNKKKMPEKDNYKKKMNDINYLYI